MQCFIFHNSIYMPEASLETRQLEYHFVFTQSKQYKAYSHCLCSMKCHDSAIEVSIYHISSQTWDHLHVHFTLNHLYISYKCLHPSPTQHCINTRSHDVDKKIQWWFWYGCISNLLMQNTYQWLSEGCSNSTANAVQLLQSCVKPSIYACWGKLSQKHLHKYFVWCHSVHKFVTESLIAGKIWTKIYSTVKSGVCPWMAKCL